MDVTELDEAKRFYELHGGNGEDEWEGGKRVNGNGAGPSQVVERRKKAVARRRRPGLGTAEAMDTNGLGEGV